MSVSPKKAVGDTETAVIKRSELDMMRNLIAGSNTTQSVEGSREAWLQKARERKDRMIAMDEERRRCGAVAKSADDVEKEATRSKNITMAKRKIDEEIDEVKHMNQVMLYAKCVTVRDAQILEKKALKEEHCEEERRVDMMMELERLKALRMYEERESKRVEDRRKGAAVIRAQIEEREQERLRKIELKQQEQEAMLRHIDKMKDEDRSDASRKKDSAKRLMEDIALANAEQIRLKNRQREMEQEEERQIAEYVREKEKREQDHLDEQRRIKAEKEQEIARLRSKQEKAQDKQAELDALRARRAQEAYDRELRQRERDAQRRATAINADLEQAREMQMREKEYLLADQARTEKDEFERIIAVQKMEEESERARRIKENEIRKRNADALKMQIVEVEEGRRKNRRDFLEEGNKIKMEKRERESLVDAIRLRKVEEMESLNVPKQYRSEILKKKALEPLRPSL